MSKTKTINNPLLDEYKNKVGVSAAPTTGSYAEYINTPSGAIVTPGANGAMVNNVPTVTPTGGQSMTVDTTPTVVGGGTVNGGGGVNTAGTGTGTGATGGATGTGPVTEAPSYDSYASWLQAITDQHMRGIQMAGNVRASMAQLSQEERDRLYEDAALARKRSVYDAGVARQQNSAAYGKNAEALAQMGLTGSGYSEYLEGKALATERGDIQAANALEANAKRQADSAYRQGLLQADSTYAQLLSQADTNYYNGLIGLEQQKIADKATADATANSNYLALLEMSKTGNFTAEEISALAGKLGLSDEEVESITSSATKAEQDKTTANTTEILSTITGAETNQAIDDAITDPAQREKAYAQRDQLVLQQYITATGSASDKFEALARDKASGLLTDAGYKEGNFNTFLEMIDGESDLVGKLATIEAQIDKYAREGKITETDAKALKQYATSKGVVSVDVDYGRLTKRDDIAGLFWFSVPGDEQANKCSVKLNSVIGKNELSILQKIEPEIGQLVKIGDKYYAYVSVDGFSSPKWYNFEQGGKKKTFDELFDSLASRTGATTRPTHTA